MPAQDTSNIKEKILYALRTKGPSLPAHIAKETGLSILFASAFLSELASENKVRISHMKVGSSPVYYIPGQEIRLESFTRYLNNKEKEAFLLLKEKKFLKDLEQHPAVRVALREIKDFAVPFKRDEEIFWRYFSIPENQLVVKQPKPRESKKPTLGIFEKPKITKKKTIKKNDKFFNMVKEFLLLKSVEIVDIELFSKNELVLRVKRDNKEEIIIACNKKRINEEDILKAYKNISDKSLKYSILCLGGPLKRTKNLIESIKNLNRIEEINTD